MEKTEKEKEIYKKAYWDFIGCVSDTLDKHITEDSIKNTSPFPSSTIVKVMKGLIVGEIHSKMMEVKKDEFNN